MIGLSLIVATFTIFLYKVPPSSWSLPWLRSALRGPAARSKGSSSEKDLAPTPPSNNSIGNGVASVESEPKESKADLDREAMPPPLLLKKPNASDVQPSAAPRARQTTSHSPYAKEPDSLEGPVLSFPAANSAQRAGGVAGPPRLNPIPRTQPPLRSLSSSSSSPRAPIANRGQPSSLAPPQTQNSLPGKPRQKVQLTPGHSPLDWARLSDSPNVNLRGVPASSPLLKVPISELRKHNGRKDRDAWTVLGGKVYNITPYLPYHPGGELELLKCAGRDGSKLFAEVHPWVNWEGMLGACLIGIAVGDLELTRPSALEDMD